MKYYKHQADKTTMKQYYKNKMLLPIEKLLTSKWPADTVTLNEQLPLLLANFYFWSFYTKFDQVDNYAFIIMTFALQ